MMEFPKPDCSNCGHANDQDQCVRTDGECRHIYKPIVIEHVFTPVKYHRKKEAMEYERVINRDGGSGSEPVANGKLILSSNQLWEVFHTQSDRAISLSKWCLTNVVDDPDNIYKKHPQKLEYDEDEESD